MPDKAKTPEDLAADNLAKAKKVSDDRNKSRVDMLNAIADNNDNSPESGMKDTDGDLVLSDANDNKLKSADQSAAEEAARAEEEARALQAEGVGEDKRTVETKSEAVTEEIKEDSDQNSKDINGVTHYKTIVNGKEKWLTLDQLIATSQKVESADEYLENAKIKAAEKESTVTEPKEEAVKEEPVDWTRTLHAAVMGDEEAIKKVASALQQRPSEMTPDVVRQIDDRWSFRRAAEWFEEEYQDVLGDPLLKKLVYDEDASLAEKSPQMPYKQRLKEAGDKIRNAVSSWQKSPEKVETKPSAAKAEAKRQLAPVPSAAARQQTATEEEPEESLSDAIAKMAKARGQDRAIIHRPTSR